MGLYVKWGYVRFHNELSEFFEAEDNYEVYFVGTVRIEGYYEKNNKHITYTNCSNLSYIL